MRFSDFMELLLQIFNCCVDMFSKSQFPEAIDWTNQVLDLASLVSPANDDERAQFDMLFKNSTRLLGMY